jgi:HEAT repeat protein
MAATARTVALLLALTLLPLDHVCGQSPAAPEGSQEQDDEITAESTQDVVDLDLTDSDDSRRVRAAIELGRRGDTAPFVIDGLLSALADPALSVRQAASDALALLHVDAGQALAARLVDPTQDEVARRRYATVLTRVGRAAASTIQQLLPLLADAHDPCRSEIADAIGSIGVTDEAVLSALGTGVRDSSDSRFQHSCARALAKLAPAGSRVLADALGDARPEVRDVVVTQLGNATFQEEFVRLLVRALSDESATVANHAAEALGRFGVRGKAALPALIAASASDHVPSAKWAVAAIGRDLKTAGQAEWWLVLTVFWPRMIALVAFLGIWWMIAPRLLRGRRRVQRATLTSFPPTLVAAASAWFTLREQWVAQVLPERYPLSAVPLEVSVAITVAVSCFLVSIALTKRPPLNEDGPPAIG